MFNLASFADPLHKAARPPMADIMTPLAPHKKCLAAIEHFPLRYQMPSDPPLKGLKVVELGGMAPVPFVGYPSVLSVTNHLKAHASRLWS